jgi:hypothetical protein
MPDNTPPAPTLTVNQLRDHLTRQAQGGHGDKIVVFGPEDGDPIAIGGGILTGEAVLLAPIKLDKVGGF